MTSGKKSQNNNKAKQNKTTTKQTKTPKETNKTQKQQQKNPQDPHWLQKVFLILPSYFSTHIQKEEAFNLQRILGFVYSLFPGLGTPFWNKANIGTWVSLVSD